MNAPAVPTSSLTPSAARPSDHPLVAAARAGDLKKVRAALAVPRDRPDLAGALWAAIQGEHLKVLPALVAACDGGFTEARAAALLLAAQTGAARTVRALMALPAPEGVHRAFLYAVQAGHTAVVRVLSPTRTSGQRGEALRLAVDHAAPAPLVRLLCRRPRDRVCLDEALTAAAIQDKRQLVDLLLQYCSVSDRLRLLAQTAMQRRDQPARAADLARVDACLSAALDVEDLKTLDPADLAVLPAARAKVEGHALAGLLVRPSSRARSRRL